MGRMSKEDREDFKDYLHKCTNSQVRGVYEKELAAGRSGYVRLALLEAAARGLTLRYGI